MAEVVFTGQNVTGGFRDPDVDIIPANLTFDTEVTFEDTPFSPSAGGPTVVETFSPSLTPAPEFTTVELGETGTAVGPIPFRTNLNENDIIFMVVGGPTVGARAINVVVAAAPVPHADGTSSQPNANPQDLNEFQGRHAPSGLGGKIALFGIPTNLADLVATNIFQDRLNIDGVTGLIDRVGIATGMVASGIPFLRPGFPDMGWEGFRPATLTDQIISIIFSASLPFQPTIGDRLTIDSVDRSLRQTPVIEIVLE